ncbi:MAG: 3-oxoacyl-reductase [Deltaproteobacteria bacterium]|nr:3-oxoacyl-reductase [Deltaproteobacteria bacterium]
MSGRPIALVTGAARGIGAACARALAGEGFRVAIHYNTSSEAAEKLAGELPESFALRADLAVPAQVEALLDTLGERAGRVDVLVNNAGLTRNAPTPVMKLDDYDAVAALARGTWYLTKLMLRRFMMKQKSGRIIQISSVVGHIGNRGQSPYTMAKAGLDALTRSLALELADRNILVNSVAPGFIETEMAAALPDQVKNRILERIPLGRMGTPEEVAEVVAFLATRGSYIQGSVIHVNGGLYGG